jgi:NADPH-dependent glutamate synthase beta subunit-like oxidoreductase/ferredoxin
MPRLTIDQRDVEVPLGATILDAAQALGIEIPTLCHLKGRAALTSCLVCMVKLRNPDRLVPSCGTQAVDGMVVESDTAEVHQVRKTALELLLSDHVGDCLAPCYFTCPAHMDIPTMLRQIGREDFRGAIATVKAAIAMPAVLGRICPKPCEKGCRRNAAGDAVAVCQLKRFVADADLASPSPFTPDCKSETGRRVAIVGAGPTGLSAAYYLRRAGHAVTLFDDRPEPGGRLLKETSPDELPREVLAAEIASILAIGPELRSGVRVGESPNPSLDDLVAQYDAVLIACGHTAKEWAARWTLNATPHGIQVDRHAYKTNRDGVFAAGNAIRAHGMVVRSVADGREAAAAIDRCLRHDATDKSSETEFSVRIGKIQPRETALLVAQAGSEPRRDAVAGFTPEQAKEQAARCLHCDCRALATCALRRYAASYGADPARYHAARKELQIIAQRSQVIYEPGKCIRCGLCIEIATANKEPLGLSFVGRGFDVRVGVPFQRPLEEALGKVAAECVAACPTAALSFKDEAAENSLPILRS